MYQFSFFEVALLIIGSLWLGFAFGKHYGRDKQRRADKLYRRASETEDPEERERLLIEWNSLGEDGQLRRAFKNALLLGKRRRK